jgi:(E)-4-hydroxy-3-methylbut-2-enyl-diphosphate synthase
VTEAGDGEDGRIKGSIGIGSLLMDGLGDTIRVSLTEDRVYEIPVARAIADKAMSLWRTDPPAGGKTADAIDPFHFERRVTPLLPLGPDADVGPERPPRVIVRVPALAQLPAALAALNSPLLRDTPAEGLAVPVESRADLEGLQATLAATPAKAAFLVLDLGAALQPADVGPLAAAARGRLVFLRRFAAGDAGALGAWLDLARQGGHFVAVDAAPADLGALAPLLAGAADRLILTYSGAAPAGSDHPVGAYRRLVDTARDAGCAAPVWIRNTAATAVRGDNTFLSKLVEASFLTGSLLCDGVGDLVSIETEADPARATRVSYNVLQGAGARISKTEFVACPSCGRTLFDLQTTTQRIRAQTGHLKGVKIAIMGCIVNGPGEMADADFGYVGGAPGKINLYVGKQCVQYNIPQAEADARLIALIKEHKKWAEPEPASA